MHRSGGQWGRAGRVRAAPVVYARTDFTVGYPHGLDTEVVAVSALDDAYARGPDDYEREHATPFIWRRSESCTLQFTSWGCQIDGTGA